MVPKLIAHISSATDFSGAGSSGFSTGSSNTARDVRSAGPSTDPATSLPAGRETGRFTSPTTDSSGLSVGSSDAARDACSAGPSTDPATGLPAGRETGRFTSPTTGSSGLSVGSSDAARDVRLAGSSADPATGPPTGPTTDLPTSPSTRPSADLSVVALDIRTSSSNNRRLELSEKGPNVKAGDLISPSTGSSVDHSAAPREDQLLVSQLVYRTDS